MSSISVQQHPKCQAGAVFWAHTRRGLRVPAFVTFCAVVMSLWSPLPAHEGHKPLPTRGMEVDVDTGKMLLTSVARETLDVRTGEVEPREVSQSILAYGTLVSPWTGRAMVSSPLSGRITELLVASGESVIAGQPLARLDSPELDLLLLELRTAQAALDLSLRLAESTAVASRSGAIPEMRDIEARNQVRQNRAALEIARAKWLGLQLPGEQLDQILGSPDSTFHPQLSLVSPISGTVTHADLSVGKVVSLKEHLFEVLDLTTIWLKVGVLEKDLASLHAGQPFELMLTAYPGEVFKGRLEVPGQLLDPVTHLGTAWASLANPVGQVPRLLPGMSGRVELKFPAAGMPVVVPLAAVVRNGAERFVLVEEEQTQVASTFQKQTVVLGRRMGDVVELRGGSVYPGDRVVTRGSHELGSFFTQGVLRVNAETARDISLTLEPAAQIPVAQTLTVDGLVELPPSGRASAAAQLSGSIAAINVERGQKVQAGDVLAEIMSQDFQSLQLELLRAHLDAELQQAVMTSLNAAQGAVTQRRLWEAESQLNQANTLRDNVIQRLMTAGLTESQLTELTTSRRLFSTLPVRAPIDGVVVDFDKLLGHMVLPDESVFEIHDLSHVWVRGFVSERDLGSITLGQAVRVRLVADESQVVEGILVRSSRAVSPDSRTLDIWVELQQMPRVAVQHNMLARLTVETGRPSRVLAVSRQALIREGSRTFLFVRGSEDIFERRLVQPGRSDDRYVEILDGLAVGEQVVVGGAAAMQTGYAALR